MSTRSVVQETADAIAFWIVSGKYGPGERLPSVRKLAAEFSINPSTVQVVLAHLQSSGLVSPHPGLGFIVRDIELYGGIASWRYIFRFAQQLPERAVRIFEQILEFRLLVILDCLRKIASDPARYDSAQVRRAVEQYQLLVRSDPENYVDISRAEVQAFRLLLVASGQSVHAAVMNSIGEVYFEVPAVMRTMCAHPKQHLSVWYGLLDSWEQRTLSEKSLPQVAELFRDFDRKVLGYFRKYVASPDYQAALAEAAER